MNARFLLDTNAISEPARPTPDPAFMGRFELHRHVLATAAPAWHEALYGLQSIPPGRKRDTIERYLLGTLLPTIEVLPYDEECAAWHAAERARLRAGGAPPPFADGQIAAVAARFELTLVTNNPSDFTRYTGLRIVNWMSQSRPRP